MSCLVLGVGDLGAVKRSGESIKTFALGSHVGLYRAQNDQHVSRARGDLVHCQTSRHPRTQELLRPFFAPVGVMLRGDVRWSSMPVIVITSAKNPAKERELLELGASAVMGKPVSPAAVSQLLSTLNLKEGAS